jgi:hypothetical protein
MQPPKNLKKLEAALPSLIKKLKALKENLSPEEQTVFSELVESAALHTEVVQAHEEGPEQIIFAKPKSVYSTLKMKAEYVRLPSTLGLTKAGGRRRATRKRR